MNLSADDKKAEAMVNPEKLDIQTGELRDLDAAEVFLRENNFSSEYVQELLSDEAGNKRLVRRVDLILLPLLCVTFLLQYIDKQALSYAAVFDLFTDANITQDQYALFPSMFYIAYLVAEYPWSYLAQKTLMAKVTSGCVICWGAVLMATAACNNYAGLAACRFLLGIFEAPITPCFTMIVGMWYTRDQQPFRTGLIYSCNGLGSMIGGVLSYAIGQIQTFPVWKAIFLLCGGLTTLWGLVLLVYLPDSIIVAKRFTLEEKATLIGRGKLGRTGILNQSIKLYQIKEAVLDPQVWLLTLFVLLNEMINGGVANFGKLIIKGLVHDSLRATALGIPMGAFQILWILSGTYMASRFRNVRTLVMAGYLIPTLIGTSLMWKLDRSSMKIGVLFGYYICGAFVASLATAMQMPATNLGGYTKRMTATAIVFGAYCVGNIVGPHFFLGREAPTYPTGCKVIIGCSVAQMFVALSLRMLLSRRNKKRDAEAAAANAIEDPAVDELSADKTDFENPKFRYVF
ncbi:major facilitator superfamily transporter [Pseudomassariella vexata]|uniref:Major facilitator superfamily transporter n=1 Tax=Pseudomassariella vexata TaxID=1141098 RepID=A0A1Y2E486_9PEZI|nr:major facilitator superfamily transporter [Pseudomassariella vexata]ORY66106.1 major facilitator superfamily transporter [Pseudomassariella vexata]